MLLIEVSRLSQLVDVPLVGAVAQVRNDALVQVGVADRVLLLLLQHLAVLGVVASARVLHVGRLVQDVVLKLERGVVTRHVMRAMGLLGRAVPRVLD